METANYSALMELNNLSVRLSFIARKLLLLFFFRIKTDQSGGGYVEYASQLAGYGINSVIARSIFLFLCRLQGRNHDETFVRRHMTT